LRRKCAIIGPTSSSSARARIIEPLYLSINDQEDVLQNVLGIFTLDHHVADVAEEPRLDRSEKLVESHNITRLCHKHEERFLFFLLDRTHPNIMSVPAAKVFEMKS
jgi:hypothetical protein